MRVVSWNVQHLSVYTDVDVPAEEHFARALEDLFPDVLLLQEVDEFNRRSGNVSHVRLAAEATASSDFRFLATPPDPGDYGIAIVSRVPVVAWSELRLPASPVGQRLTFLEDGEPHRYYVADHARAAIAATLANGWTVVNTHCSFVPGVAQLHALRVWQWASRVAREAGTRLLVGGDLNLHKAGWLRAFGAEPLRGAPTFPAWEPTRQIDHLIVRRHELAQKDLQVAARYEISDHLPVWVEL